MRSVGMAHPTEGTYRQLASVIVGTHCREGSVDQWFGIVKELKAIFISKKADKVSVVRMHVFPEGPDSLPECIYHFAYPDPEDPPKLMELDGMQHIISGIPLRISNKAVLHMTPKAPSFSSPHMPMHLAAPGMMPIQPTQPFQQPGESFLHHIASLLANPDLQRQLAGTPGIFAGAVPQPPAITMLSGAGRQSSMLPVPHAATLALEGSTGASSSAMTLSPTGVLALSPSAEPKPEDRAASMLDRMEALAQGGKELEAARKEAAKLEAAALEAAKPGPKPKAKGKAQPKATAKGKGKPKAMVKAKAKGKGKAEPKTKVKGKAAPKAGKLLLGCSKCRGHLVHDACYLHGGLASRNSLSHNSCMHTSRHMFKTTCMHGEGYEEGCAQCRNPKLNGQRGPTTKKTVWISCVISLYTCIACIRFNVHACVSVAPSAGNTCCTHASHTCIVYLPRHSFN